MSAENEASRVDESSPKKRGKKYVKKNVYLGSNRFNPNIKYFGYRKVAVPDPSLPPEEPPQLDLKEEKRDIDEVIIPDPTPNPEKTPEGIPIKPLFDPEVEKRATDSYDAFINQGGKVQDD